ncbi:PaaI family thioesterase [Peribacillus saganii]|uniref:PaaI family thioesterase n=1 Tax=Peribacillus saganii TaxID=2303992 RepID=A0A372LTC2_9BACI|nr:PaaI family thioesterase [Peribacillus saganii]RFU71147.1 PaaI family thioesterase [Peribacillus saganii]
MKEHVTKRFNEFIEKATEKDMEVLAAIFEGLQAEGNAKSPYVNRLFHFEREIKDNSITMTAPIAPITYNSLGIAHGGVIATLIDTAIGTLANVTVSSEGNAAVTTDISVRYLKAAKGGTLTCQGTILHKGKKTMILEGRVYTEEGVLCAHSTANFFIIPRP